MTTKEPAICITVQTVVRDLAHLKELASCPDGEPPIECRLLLNGGLRTTKYIQYIPARDGHNWYLEEHGEDGRYYTDTQLTMQTSVVGAMRKGALIAETEMQVEDGDILAFAVGMRHEGVEEVLNAKANNVTWYDCSHWMEILFRPFEIDSYTITRDNTRIVTLVSGDRFHFSERKQVNYPPEVDFYDWVKVEV